MYTYINIYISLSYWTTLCYLYFTSSKQTYESARYIVHAITQRDLYSIFFYSTPPWMSSSIPSVPIIPTCHHPSRMDHVSYDGTQCTRHPLLPRQSALHGPDLPTTRSQCCHRRRAPIVTHLSHDALARALYSQPCILDRHGLEHASQRHLHRHYIHGGKMYNTLPWMQTALDNHSLWHERSDQAWRLDECASNLDVASHGRRWHRDHHLG